jgi:hypothetical protein
MLVDAGESLGLTANGCCGSDFGPSKTRREGALWAGTRGHRHMVAHRCTGVPVPVDTREGSGAIWELSVGQVCLGQNFEQQGGQCYGGMHCGSGRGGWGWVRDRLTGLGGGVLGQMAWCVCVCVCVCVWSGGSAAEEVASVGEAVPWCEHMSLCR